MSDFLKIELTEGSAFIVSVEDSIRKKKITERFNTQPKDKTVFTERIDAYQLHIPGFSPSFCFDKASAHAVLCVVVLGDSLA